MNFSLPQFEQISEQRWNSVLQRNEIVGENSRRWQMDFSIQQPLILMGYPTNGYLSLNNRVYRYTQIEEDEHDLTYYNRYFVQYRQPLFQPARHAGQHRLLEQSRMAEPRPCAQLVAHVKAQGVEQGRLVHRKLLGAGGVANRVEAAMAVLEDLPAPGIAAE